MTKQEEIREYAVSLCEEYGVDWNTSTYLIDTLFVYLDSEGLVIKVERELPGCGCEICDDENGVYRRLVEPLIEEK